MRQRQPLHQPQLTVDTRQPPPTVVDAPGDHLGGHRFATLNVVAQQQRVHIDPQCVDVVHQQVAQRRTLHQQTGQHPVAQQVGHLVPVADRMQTLRRRIVGVVAALPHLLRPPDQGRMQAGPHFLRPFVEQLLRHLLPGKTQVARHRHQPQPHRPPRREPERTRIAAGAFEKFGDRPVGQITGGHNVGQRCARQPARAPALGQMNLNKVPMTPPQPRKWVERFDHTRPLRPAAASPPSQRDHRHSPRPQRRQPSLPQRRRLCQMPALRHITSRHILDHRTHRQPVLRQPNAPAAQVGTNLLVLHPVKPILVQQGSQVLTPPLLLLRRQQTVKQRLHHPRQRRLRARSPPKCIQLGTAKR